MPVEKIEKRKALDIAAESDLLKVARKIASSCNYEVGHAERTSNAALMLFDQLAPLHKLGASERELLLAASLLHDIGWINGRNKHHKTTLEIIINTRELPLPEKRRIMLGLIARYHRKSLPDNSHKYYADLDGASRNTIDQLAALLRIADGLDKSRGSVIEKLECLVSQDQIIISVFGKKIMQEDIKAGAIKADLLEKVFKKEVCVRRGREPEQRPQE
jgi:exopolyphosphatase/guanosine-5'-triphosphate,3'-diphosphate pyrophosphatase